MKKLLVSFGLVFVVAASVCAQAITTEHGSRSDAIFTKLRKVDLLNQILPLLLSKEQITTILPALEKARAREKQVLTDEDNELAKLDAQIDDVLQKAINEQKYPPKEFSSMIATKTRAMSINRQLAFGEIMENLTKVLDATLTEAQKKIMEGSFDSNFIAPGKKPEEIPAKDKRRFFIERVFLDPLTRELLISISEKMSG